MAEQTISCILYSNETADKFYDNVNRYLDKHSGINGAMISTLAFQFFAHSKPLKPKKDKQDDNKEKEEATHFNPNNPNTRHLILTTSSAKPLSKETIIAAVIQLHGVLFLSTFTNIDINNPNEVNNVIKVLCKHLHPIQDPAGLEICGNKLIIDALISELKFNDANRKEMEQKVYSLYSTTKYDKFCEERMQKSKLKLFGHLIQANAENEVHLNTIKAWYPKFCVDVGLKFKEEGLNRMIANMKSKKVYFWGREQPKPKQKLVDSKDEKKQENVEYDLVSWAAITGYTPHMARIGYVYTPGHERKKGYATHLVGHLSQIMEKENKMLWIISDKTNVASNKAYTRIGFNLESTSTLTLFS
eukprot:185668_1